MSIPAAFRRTLENGDPEFGTDTNARIVILYGPHLKGCLHAYTVQAMAEIEADILNMPRGSKKRKLASRTILSKSMELEIDRDGRIVMPKDRREQIGLEGEAYMASMGEYFEIWNATTFEEGEEAELEALLAEEGDDFDPMSLLDGE